MRGTKVVTSSAVIRKAVREENIHVALMKEGRHYLWVGQYGVAKAHARNLRTYSLEDWVAQARQAEKLLYKNYVRKYGVQK